MTLKKSITSSNHFTAFDLMSHAVFTIVRDEPFWVPVWIQHYIAQGFLPENIHILNNGGPINESTNQRINVTEVTNPVAFDHFWLRDTVTRKQKELLKTNSVVVFAEIDEFLFWKNGKLIELCDTLNETLPFIRATCYSPLQDIDAEPEYESGGLLLNRNKMLRSPGYDKTLISNVCLSWGNGFHVCKESRRTEPSQDVIMIHMWLFDFKKAWQRIQERTLAGAVGFFGYGLSEENLIEYFKNEFKTYPLSKANDTFFQGGAVPIDSLYKSIG